jgi:hypothetical protein
MPRVLSPHPASHRRCRNFNNRQQRTRPQMPSLPQVKFFLFIPVSSAPRFSRRTCRGPASSVYVLRAAADKQELADEMRRLEKLFGAQLFSSRPSSQASFRSHSPPASLNSFNGSILTDISPHHQISGPPSTSSPAAALHEQVVWMRDADAPRCLSCDKRFFFPFRRRHHCRSCGLIFCSRCCSRFVLHPNAAAVLTCLACQRHAS